MDSLEVLNKESISLLERNGLIKPLVKKELTTNILNSITLSNEEIESIRNEVVKRDAVLMKNNNLKDENEYHNWLEKSNVNKNSFSEQITKQIKLTNYCKEKFLHLVETKFLEKKTQLHKVIYSLIRLNDPYEAQELYLRITGGEACFCETAQKYSLGDEKQTLGIVGPISIDKAHPAISQMIRSSTPREISKPFKVGSWWVLIRVEELIEAKLDEGREIEILFALFDQWLDEQSEMIIKNFSN